MHLPSQCHSNERLGVVRGKIASCARVPVEQVQNLSFGEGSNSYLVTGGEQDNRLLHSIGVLTNTTVTAKISLSGAQLKEVSWNAYLTISISCQIEVLSSGLWVYLYSILIVFGIDDFLLIFCKAEDSCPVVEEVEF